MSHKRVIMSVFSIFLIGISGLGASFTLGKFIGKDPQPEPGDVTRFFVINESKIVFGEPAYYRVIIENHQGDNINYDLRVRLSGQEIYNQKIKMNSSDILNRTISFKPLSGEYQKLEFLLYKENETYQIRVFQIFPVINSSLAPNLTIAPPSLQNSNMEENIAWKFYGKEFYGNYTIYEWSSPKRSYLINALKGVKTGAFGSIQQNISSKEEGFVTLSFDVKSNNLSYYIQALVNNEIVWENSSGKDWQRIKTPVFLKKSNTFEFKVFAKNDTKSGILTWWDNIQIASYSSVKIENIKREELEPYTKQKKGEVIVYKFNTGEKLELNVSKGNVTKGNGLYTTTAIGNNIIFLGETYEKVLPGKVNYLYPVIMDVKNKRLTINETFPLKNNYSITFKQIDNQSLKLGISRNNRIVREIISTGNSSMEYWKYRNENDKDDYKKVKVMQIKPTIINKNNVVIDIIQYGDMKLIMSGSKYGEFQVTNITEDSITMKNNLSIKLEAEKVVPLFGGKIKIKV